MVLVHPISLEDNAIEGKSCCFGLTAMSQRFLPQKTNVKRDNLQSISFVSHHQTKTR